MKKLLFSMIIMLLACMAYSQQESRLMRFPAIHGNQVVFTYAGDLYTVDRTGGIARKLTNDENGYEMFARFSPDGKNIAFTGQYDGNTEVYIIPSEGGIPNRITYSATLNRDDISDRMGPNNITMAWRDNDHVVYRSRKQTFNDFKGQLFIAGIKGGLSEELPLPAGGFCSYSPDKSKLAYNRVFREFRTWKYYRGGMADDIWIYDFKTNQIENITNTLAQDIFPMWAGNKIYFCSDRDRTMNLFSYDLTTKETKKVTNFTEFDIKFPSLGDNAIVFENGGFIYVFDLNTQKAEKINIRIANDLITGRNTLKDASRTINSFSLAPDGKRVAFDGRGDIWTVPAKTGITKNLTGTSGIHEREVNWSPDGQYITYISDKTGEDEIYIQKQDGSAEAVQLTKNADTYKYSAVWSPDSKKLLWADKMLRLQYVDIDSKEVTLVDEAKDWEFNEYAWSPDSKWITYIRPVRDAVSKIYLYEVATKNNFPVTNDWYEVSNPSFSRDGKYLLFASNRDFSPTFSSLEFDITYNDLTRVYMITLSKSTPSPFAPENDEVTIKKESKDSGENKPDKDKKDAKKDEKKEPVTKTEVTVKVDADGIIDRIIDLPIDPSNYYNVNGVDDNIYYIKGGRREKPSLMMFSLKDKKETPIGEFYNYEISADSKKMLVTAMGKYAVIDLPKSKADAKDYLDLTNMKVMVDLSAEWQQIYNESWRQMKYFFYDPHMHGLDWPAIQKKYAPLVPYVKNRADLTYIIGEMIGELNVGHSYVGGGDRPEPKKVKQGLLGARISRDASGYYKIDKILHGENWTKDTRSPLTEMGVDVKEGDYIIAVNGKSTKDMIDIYESLVNKAGVQVELTINSTSSETGDHKTIVIPIESEGNLYYYEWVESNIKKVNDATHGEVGYIHIPDMGTEGLNEFIKHFYPQLSKRALIIDDRGNGGGNVSPIIIERLRRQLIMMEMSRNTTQSPADIAMEWGPKCLLIDQYSASDGDLFPYRFRQFKLGKIIGLRSWGGVVGIRGSLPFIDGGFMMKPEFAHYSADSKWVIEGHGVDPDIVVDNEPAKEYAGEDQQLEKAIQVITDELKTWPKELPAIPPFPDKTK
ncbi:MAG: PDZ domain-containing protein [Bacteroidetes bacterium]|nr:PDZ domain-containing protein [Bacteroidota bacterium]